MTIAIINEKGGSGKTTLSLNLSARIAIDGDKTLLIDADPQNSTSVFCENRVANGIEQLFSTMSKTGESLGSDLKLIKLSCDSIIIDTGDRDSKEMRKAILYSDVVIIPTTASSLDTKVINYIIEIIKGAKDFNENLLTYIVVNKATTNKFLSNELDMLRSELNDIIGENQDIFLLNHQISQRVSYKRAINSGLSIIEYSDEKAKNEFESFYKEFEKSIKLNIKKFS
ncbi:AAA family ATPase [Campylobacter hyointestinalis]|uniref:AAA family ATPase n=1 Tax=Campylobacter hyointestinalis TaxID=198 RepID=UPI000DCF32D8|nr:AAA family ATPase [Campylobacter hyointestinalis]RAZ60971.1 chromosome partitioning protein ParA [Campylobacter hyointestinalis subsp. lawsonii]